MLRAYAVLKEVFHTDDERPYKIVRIDVSPPYNGKDTMHVVIADHPVRNLACYWANRLNEGRCTEDQCKEGIGEYT